VPLLIYVQQGQTRRREAKGGRAPKASLFSGGRSRGDDGGQPQIKKATFEITKKKEVGVSDLTLLSKVSNEAINDNLKKRFEHGEIYVRKSLSGRLSGRNC
jgi:hypothetical protein